MYSLSIDPEKEVERITIFLHSSLKKTPFSKYIVALSGGVDSAVVYSLAIKAIGEENVYALFLPHGRMSAESLKRAKLLCDKMFIPQERRIEKDIEEIVHKIASLEECKNDNIRLGNIMARTRMILLYDQAKEKNALVCGTENRTEKLLGYFTRFGDEASDVEPIIHLYKTQVKKLAESINIPAEIINADPTADLWVGQTDEKEFGFAYEEADKVLHLKYDQRFKEESIIKSGIPKEIVQKVVKRAMQNSYKHNVPYKLNA